MAGSVNKVILVGNLGRDPEVRSFPNGGKVVNLRVATSERWRDKQTGENKERTEWHSVAIFNENLGRIAEQYLRKGSKVYLEGQLETRKWQDQSGQDRYTTEVVLRQFRGELTLLDGRGEGAGAGGGDYDQDRGSAGGGAGRGARQHDRRRDPVLSAAPGPPPSHSVQRVSLVSARGHTPCDASERRAPVEPFRPGLEPGRSAAGPAGSIPCITRRRARGTSRRTCLGTTAPLRTHRRPPCSAARGRAAPKAASARRAAAPAGRGPPRPRAGVRDGGAGSVLGGCERRRIPVGFL